MKKLLILFLCVAFIAVYNSSCNKESEKSETAENNIPDPPGKTIFQKNCKLCHGSDGTLGMSGAANLKISKLTPEEKIQVITNGRRGMTSWKDQLSPEEIKLVAEYVETLKNN